MQEAIRTRSKKTSEPLLEGLDESRWRRGIRTSRELFPPPEILLQPSPQGFRVNLVKEVKKERDEIRKDTKKCKKEKPQVPLNGSLPLSGTQELTGDPLRGKMAAEGFRVNLVKEVKKERDEIRKDTKKCKKEKSQVPLSGSLLLSGTQELTGDPLRGKMAAEGKNRADALTAERHYFWALA
ncbi:hypothetical protein LR48_Vigan11g063900 [Vigna angularis]|uniref:Uncharacterized protein n=1 Tax=Phaseolus angularis TaxID=3914 RepID=A0A0L9VRA7_PHAAN|nr:hypothetical protein LR48_Vigan11g063900 [Vigna angularis]